jgi:hypothetical protein
VDVFPKGVDQRRPWSDQGKPTKQRKPLLRKTLMIEVAVLADKDSTGF